MTEHHQLSTFLLALMITTSTGDVCVYKECTCYLGGISCAEQGLTAIPQLIPLPNTSYQELDLDTNNITRIPAGHLPANLVDLSIINNPITAIDEFAFNDSALTLQNLAFSHITFTKLPDAFLHLKNLTSLSISESLISDWNVDAMKNLGQTLEILLEDNCGLTSWPDWIQYLPHLTQLALSSNYIYSIPDDALDNMASSLSSLSLDNNNLTSVPKALSKLTALTNLNLLENRISEVRWLPQASKVLSISLGANMIYDADQLSKALVPYSESLYYLDIETNRLLAIPNFPFLTQIQSLDFSNNRISDSISGTLPPKLNTLRFEYNALPLIPRVMASVKSVPDMVLTSNMIREIHAADFPSWISTVELGYNLIGELTDTSFPENSSIQILELNNNPISRISSNVFTNLPRLFRLDMQFTKLTRLPLGLPAASSLTYFDFTGNTNLVCTCEEKSLQPWIKLLPADSVLGDCGIASIYYFFNVLSQSCP